MSEPKPRASERFVRSGEGVLKRSIYSYLGELVPGRLFLDVGAAAGGTCSAMLKFSPESRVIAFEPFPGNWPFFEDAHAADPRVDFRRSAVGATSGTASFAVAPTVTASTPGWQNMVGYSSGGFLDAEQRSGRETIETEVVAIDDVVDEHVGLMKIDVQGGELDVLTGSRNTIARHGIDLIYCEYSGQADVLEFLIDNGYIVFFTEHLLVQRKPEDDLSAWRLIKEKPLSSGRSAFAAWPPETMPLDASGYADFIRAEDRRLMNCQTDLLCVSAQFYADFAEKVGGR